MVGPAMPRVEVDRLLEGGKGPVEILRGFQGEAQFEVQGGTHRVVPDGFSARQHLDVLGAHAPGLRVDAVVADTDAVDDARGLMSGASALGGRLVLAPVAAGDGTARHDPQRLAAAYREVLHGGSGSGWGRGTGVSRWR